MPPDSRFVLIEKQGHSKREIYEGNLEELREFLEMKTGDRDRRDAERSEVSP